MKEKMLREEGRGKNSLWVRKETTVEIMNNAHLIRFVRSSLVAQEKLGSGFRNQSCPLTLIVNSAGTGLSPALRCGQSFKLKKAVFKTSDPSESEERKQKQGCAFVAHPFYGRPRETLPSEVALQNTAREVCRKVAQSWHLSSGAPFCGTLGMTLPTPFPQHHNVNIPKASRASESGSRMPEKEWRAISTNPGVLCKGNG